jgi:hypothetical protein
MASDFGRIRNMGNGQSLNVRNGPAIQSCRHDPSRAGMGNGMAKRNGWPGPNGYGLKKIDRFSKGCRVPVHAPGRFRHLDT